MNHKEHKEIGPFVIFAFSVVKSFVFQPKDSSAGDHLTHAESLWKSST